MNAEKNEEQHQRKTLKKVWKQKIKDIENALDRGEDINVAENDKGNTLLHTAVLNAEVDVVKCLLNKKADTTIKNSAGQTALEIAELLKCSDGKQIVSLLRKYQNGNYHSTRLENNSDSQQKQLKNKSKVTKLNKSYHYQKRTGASGINGQHYETKLLSLILLRALHDSEIEEFYLGTNVAGLGAFDDIVLRYKKHGEKQTNILFLQAKHKDDPEKDKVSVGDTLKEDGNFSLHKYLESYMISPNKFCSDSENEMLKLPLNNLNCEFIIYTPAIENFNEQTVMTQTEGEHFIQTCERGKICQFHANDTIIEQLAPTVKKTLAKKIAERLANFKNQKTVIMMTDDIIKVYHVFLAQHVLYIVPKKHCTHGTLQEQDNKSNNIYIEVKFRQSFHETKDEHLLLMKNIICKDLKILKGKTAAEIEDQLKSLTFEVPANFGNVDFHIKEDEKEKQKTLKYFCSIFDKLFAEDCIVEIKESDIGSDKSLQPTDIDKLGSLVGNLLILDQETKLLKFNLQEDHLSNDSLRLLKLLYKNNHHISRYRLDVMIPWFPKLILSKYEDDKYLVIEFLKQLKFYTNQAKEDEVEVILKKEIDVLYNLKDNDSIIRAKCDAVFLKFHAQVQSWWKQPGWTEYLTKTCQFYNEAKRDTLDSPLLSILNYTNNYKMKTYGTKFKPSAINALKITDFIKDDNANVLFVVSNEITLSSIKCFQYFGDNYDYEHTFLDLESVIRNHYLEIVEKELKDTKCSVLVIIDQTGSASQEIFHAVKKAFHGKIVLITIANISDKLKNKLSDGAIQRIDDNTNIFTDLENEFQKMILLKRELLFQGQKVSVTSVLDTEFLRAVQPIIIYKFINNETIVVGQMLTDKLYKTSIGFYINQSLCRYVTLNKQNEENNTYLYSINDCVPESVKPRHDCDIILITERLDYFEYICKENKNRNVHWFKFKHEITGSNNIIWLKSKGQLMIKDKDRGLKVTYQVMPKTVRDIEEKMVLISGESGMGKSTLLSHLAVHTKQKYPTMWVSKINFQDHFEQFSRWKSDKTNIDLVEIFKFLYSAIDTKAFKDNETQNILEKIGNCIVINNINEIHLNSVDLEADLFEIYVFNHCYNNNRVVLLFDGFDEVCPDYADEAIQFLSTLKSSKVAHIWVTTRPYNFINQLQCALGILSFKIMPFNQLEQEQCLKKKWTKNLGVAKQMSACKLYYQLCTYFCFMTQKNIISRIDESFMGFPLHIYLIADYFQIYFDEYLTYVENIETSCLPLVMHVYDLANFNLWTLYEKFIEKIFFTIHLGVKTSSASFKDPKLRKMLEKEHKDFLNGHKKISAYTLFEEVFVKEWFSFEDFQDVNNLMENVKLGDEKAGIIECVIGKRPKFVHSTFCEYFATEFIFDILKSDSCTSSFWEYLITDIFVTDNKSGIRKFINCKLSEKHLFHETFYTKYSNEVLEILLSQSCLLLFAVAIKERLDNIAIFILKCARSAINKDNLESLIKLSSTEICDVSCLNSYVRPKEKKDGFFHHLFSLIFEIDPKATDYKPMRVLRGLMASSLGCALDEDCNSESESH